MRVSAALSIRTFLLEVVADPAVDFAMANFHGKDERFVREWLICENFKSDIVTTFEGLCRSA